MSTCLWVRIPEPIEDQIYTFVSYATPDDDGEMLFENLCQRDGTLRYRLLATITKRRFWFTEDPGFKEWTFWCFTWSMNPESWLLYLDGSQIISDEENSTSNPNPKMIQGGGVLIFGQDQDEVGGGFSLHQAFEGSLTEFNLWNRFITKQEIGTLMQSTCAMEYENSIISWKYSAFELFDVTESDQDTWNIQSEFLYLLTFE
ncbi:neuronal pentraxin-2-like [Ptychodera flava]|uniref:neuronal pentraxin-2-like n=1 Tax=Ptychodera flava TaxID=63121 RepID=UPI00396AAF7A